MIYEVVLAHCHGSSLHRRSVGISAASMTMALAGQLNYITDLSGVSAD